MESWIGSLSAAVLFDPDFVRVRLSPHLALVNRAASASR